MRFAVFIAAVLVVASFALSSYNFFQLRQASSADENAPGDRSAHTAASAPAAPTEDKVVALGRLEPEGGVIEISGLAGDRVAEILVAEGQQVEAGQPLAVFESRAMRKAELAAAKTAVTDAVKRKEAEAVYARALVAEAEMAGDQVDLARLDIEAQQAQIEVLKARLEASRNDLKRLEAVDGQIVSPQELERQGLLVQQAAAELGAAESQLTKLRGSIEFNERAAESKLATARAAEARVEPSVQLDSLNQQVALAEARLATTEVRAPVAAQVLKILTQVGETMGAAPILRLGRTAAMWVSAEVYETDAQRVQPGQRARITSAALPSAIDGVVEQVGLVVGKNEVMSLDPTRSADLRVVEVKIKLADSAATARLVNLQVTVEIDTASTASASAAKAASRSLELAR